MQSVNVFLLFLSLLSIFIVFYSALLLSSIMVYFVLIVFNCVLSVLILFSFYILNWKELWAITFNLCDTNKGILYCIIILKLQLCLHGTVQKNGHCPRARPHHFGVDPDVWNVFAPNPTATFKGIPIL